jgi:hypothetical protein
MLVNTRRQNALKAHGGDFTGTGRALQALANATTYTVTKREAKKDADYFFSQAKKARQELSDI